MIRYSRVTVRELETNVAETLSYLQSLNPSWVYAGVVGQFHYFSISV